MSSIAPWSASHNRQWDEYRSTTSFSNSIHRLYSIRRFDRAYGVGIPTPHELRTRATSDRRREEAFADATLNDRLWALAIVADQRMTLRRERPREVRDLPLLQLLHDGLYDMKDVVDMSFAERRMQRFTSTGLAMVYDHVCTLEDEVCGRSSQCLT